MRSKSASDVLLDICVYTIITMMLIMIIYPFYYSLVLSFNDGLDASRGGVFFWPRRWSFDNYLLVFTNEEIYKSALVTVARTALGTVCSIVFTGLFAYSISHADLYFRKVYMMMMLISMYFSGGIIPYFVVIKSIGLYDSFLVYIIPALFSFFNAIIMMSFFRGIPKSLEESAQISGANHLTIFFRIIFPVSLPVFATIAIFTAVGHWNDWFATTFYTKAGDLKTLAYVLKEIITQADLTSINNAASRARASVAISQTYTAESIQMATMIVIIFPIICTYPFLQKYFIKGIMIGSIKG